MVSSVPTFERNGLFLQICMNDSRNERGVGIVTMNDVEGQSIREEFEERTS